MNSRSDCQDCAMSFQNVSQLANHKKKFCLNSKYGGIDQLEKNFQDASKSKDLSKFGKLSLSMQGRNYDLQKNIQNTNQLDEQYRKIIKKIQDQKNLKNKLQAQKQKAFRELQALQKQQEQLIIDDKRNNLQEVIKRRQALAREEEQLQKQLKQYQNKKRQWQKSQAKGKQTLDRPFEQGKQIGKIAFQRQMLQQRKHDMEMELNAKRRQKQKLEQNLLKMSSTNDIQPISKASQANVIKNNRSIGNVKIPQAVAENKNQYAPKQFDYSRLNNDRARPQTQSQVSKMSSYLTPNALDGTQKILKFNLNKQGKSQQDKLIQAVMAQQYDDLLILSKLPKGSQLYNVKMKQYAQLSKKRMQVQQKAQKQRVQKMKRQFQFEKIILQKQKQNAQWVNDHRKQFMLKQLDLIKQNDQNGNNPIQLPNQIMQGSLNSIILNPSINNIPSGVQDLPKGDKHPSIVPNVPQLNSQKKPGVLQSYPFDGGPRKSDNRKKKDPFGYRVSILALRNYSLKKAIKVKLIIYEQYYHEKDKGMKYQFATIYHDQTLDQKDPFNPHFRNKLDATGAIAYNESFYVPQNLQQLYNKNQKQIYLLLIVAEKDQKKLTNQPRPYCWYSFKITHFGQIKQGRFTVNLYGDQIIYPWPADMNKMKKKKQQQITFQLQQVLLDEHMLNQAKKSQNSNANNSNTAPNQNSKAKIPSQNVFNPTQSGYEKASIQNNLQNNPNSKPSIPSRRDSAQNPNDTNGSRVNMNYPLKMKNVEEGDVINVNEQYFYSNQKTTQFSHVQLRKPLNFDVSVAGLRTLPSYIGPVKLQMSFIDADGAHVLPRQQFLAEVGTDLYNPLVNYTRKIRNQSKLPPSTIIFIRMIALSALDYQIYSLGFSLLYLFLDKNGDTIKSNKVTDYLMTSGYYQLPIYWGNIEPRYIDIEQLLLQYPPIPCVSLLIGILQNASKISNPMPAYSQKVYNTILFLLDDNQAKLFSEQYKREPIDTNTLISGYLQYKGIKKNYSGEQINKYLFKTLTFSSQNTKTKLQLKWMAEYQEYFGINFVIDKLCIPETELMYYYFITICISPPANYYKKKSFDLKFCRNIDMEVSTTTQFFFYDNQFFINPAYFKNSSIIVQVNRIQIFESENTQADNNIQGFAYIVIPVFQIQEKIRSVNVTQARLPLFQGDFDSNNIEKLQKNLPNYMQSNQKSKKSKAELSFRILNGYFMNQFHLDGPTNDPKATMYRDIPPKNMSFQNAIEDINSILSSNYNMQIT